VDTNGHHEPVAVPSDELTLCSCLNCHDAVWYWPGETLSDGRALTFDRETVAGEDLLCPHLCEEVDREPEEYDDPDWGWIV
jgi:hypothetical protein